MKKRKLIIIAVSMLVLMSSIIYCEDEETILENIRSSNPDKRMLAARYLAVYKDERAVTALIETLKDNQEYVRKTAIDSLSGMGEPAVPQLLKNLSNKDIKKHVILCLGRIGDKKAITPLMGMLKTENKETRQCIIDALSGIKAAAELEIIVEDKETGADLKSAAAAALGKTGKEGEPVLIKLLKNSNRKIRLIAAGYLAVSVNKEALPVLAEGLEDADKEVRKSTVNSLVYYKNEAIPYLVNKGLKDSNTDVRYASVYALGEIGEYSVVEELKKLEKDRSESVKRAVTEAIEKLERLKTFYENKKKKKKK